MRWSRFLTAAGHCGGLTAGMILGVVALLVLAAPVSAGTSDTGGGAVGNGTITATASSESADSLGTGGSESGNGTSGPLPSGQAGGHAPPAPPSCTYVPAPSGVSVYLGPGEGGSGTWYVASCSSSPTQAALSFPVVWVPAAPATAQRTMTAPSLPSVHALVQRALAEAPLLRPSIELDPPADQVVFVPTWLWIPPEDWHPVTVSAVAGTVTATVTAAPTAVSWSFGDGQRLSCPGPGVAYQPAEAAGAQGTYCSHVWTTSSASAAGGAFTVSASIDYRVTVTVLGAADGFPDLGVHAGPPAQARVVVSEIEALGTTP